MTKHMDQPSESGNLHGEAERACESEQKYRSIFNLAGHGIVLVDGDTGRIVECNPEFERQTGRALDELYGLPVWHLRPPEEVDLAKTICRRVMEEGSGGSDVTHFLRPDGSKVPIDFRSKLVTIGGRSFVQSITVDITEHREIQTALRERDERLRLVIDQVPAVLWTTDADLRVTSCAGAGLESLDLEAAEIIGTTLYDHFRDFESTSDPIANHLRVLAGESVTYEVSWRGAVFEAHVEPLLDAQGNTFGCVGVALEVTERVDAEERLRISEQKLRALASRLQNVREEEAAIIAREIHDELGQTLTGLKMDISWLQRRMAEMPPSDLCAQLSDRLATMSHEADATIRTVRRISTKLRPVILDDLGLLRALEWQVEEFAGRTGIHCRLQIDTKRGHLDDERSTAVFRIFQEILTNVARHASATDVVVRLRDENGAFVLDVLDNGKGISDDDVKSSRALGILGMQERAQLCGGNVCIQQGNGRGTRVVVTVPVACQDESDQRGELP